ncbi:MAG TPA: 2-phosphosulfolactate phosphatase family protein [Xenococcaceae cyanobacterium]
MKVFVYHTPELTPEGNLPDCAVVIDVLRATTTIATALNSGAEAVQAFSDIDILMEKSARWLADKRLRAGERGGEKVPGFDLGNSPLECVPEVVTGKRLFLTTTNGTRALQRVALAPTVITAAQVNRQAVVNYLLQKQPETVWLVGSGWQGSYSVEDTACAGAIAELLITQGKMSLEAIAGNDELVGALSLYAQWQGNLLAMFHNCSHGQRLLRLNCHQDLEYCATTDILDILPIQKEAGVLVKL